ncbi:Alpha/beta hydrolase family protein [Dyadobacter sp. SG02]|uniref:carboxylesterase family protein n=1 Tax=Dyadobacter sp. SG02 TaxID=1855291 RepID=UPI0008B26567|nr:dienelactone hydrolase family protein [Dyadobacter sp. SG02]SEJ84468.1 Alpha/beta hydrolase family protein [Dyadobacter sp. SG02]
MTAKPLSKEFYSFTIFFLSILCIISLIQSVALVMIGSQMAGLGSFNSWIWLVLGVLAVTNVALIRYFWHNGYNLAAIACVVSCVAVFCQYTLILDRELRVFYQQHYHAVASVIFGTGVLWGLSLVFTKAREKRWLRLCGILTVCITLLLALIFWLYFQTGEGSTKLLIDKTSRWVSLLALSEQICLIIHFRLEEKRLAVTDNAPAQTMPALIKLAAFLGLLFLGFNFSVEAIRYNMPFKPSATDLRRSNAVNAYHFVDKSGDSLNYRLLKPLDYDSTKQYPLIVCLHHGGAHGKDNMQQLSADPAPFLMELPTRTKYPAFLFMPQSPKGLGFSGAYGNASVDSLVFRTIRQLLGKLPIDRKRIYVMGISGGGYGSWHFISMHPELFAAAIPICGGGDPKYGPKLVNVPIWAFHGARDKLAPVSHSRDMIAAIRKAGGHPKYTEYEFAGHGIWDKVGQEHIMEWMFAQHKE